MSQCIAIVVVVGMPVLQHVARSRYVGCRSIGGWIGFMFLHRRGRYIGCRNVGGCIGFVLLRSRWGYVGYRNAAFNWWCCKVCVLPSWKMSLGFPHRHTGKVWVGYATRAKFYHHKLPALFTKMFKNIIVLDNLRTKSASNLFVPTCTTTRMQKFLRYCGPKIWNYIVKHSDIRFWTAIKQPNHLSL